MTYITTLYVSKSSTKYFENRYTLIMCVCLTPLIFKYQNDYYILMAFYGLTSYDRCKELLKVLKMRGVIEISQEELALVIAQNIGSSKFYKTVRNYMTMLINFKMLDLLPTGKYKVNYGVLDD